MLMLLYDVPKYIHNVQDFMYGKDLRATSTTACSLLKVADVLQCRFGSSECRFGSAQYRFRYCQYRLGS